MGCGVSQAELIARPQVWSIRAVTTPLAMTPVSGSPTSSSRQGALITPRPFSSEARVMPRAGGVRHMIGHAFGDRGGVVGLGRL